MYSTKNCIQKVINQNFFNNKVKLDKEKKIINLFETVERSITEVK